MQTVRSVTVRCMFDCYITIYWCTKLAEKVSKCLKIQGNKCKQKFKITTKERMYYFSIVLNLFNAAKVSALYFHLVAKVPTSVQMVCAVIVS